MVWNTSNENEFLNLTFLKKTYDNSISRFNNFIFFTYLYNKICHISIMVSNLREKDQSLLQLNDSNKDLPPLKTNKLAIQLGRPINLN